MKRIGSVAVLVVLCVSVAWGQGEAPSSAPWVGEKQYSIQFEGPLRDAIRALEGMTGRYAYYQDLLPVVDMDQPVTLQFEQARLDEILLALCEQAGLVYDRFMVLRPGDIHFDPRPTVVLDDYVLRVTYVEVFQNAYHYLRWGDRRSPEASATHELRIMLQLEARSPEAVAQFAGVEDMFRATTDAGAVLVTHEHARQHRGRPFYGRGQRRATLWATLPAPSEGTRMITALEGELILCSDVKITDIMIPAGSEGETFTEDDVAVTVTQWQRTLKGHRLRLETTYPPPPAPPDDNQRWALPFMNVWHEAVGLYEGEEGMTERRWTSFGGGGPHGTVSAQFPSGKLDYVKLTVVRRGLPEVKAPFVISDIPLP